MFVNEKKNAIELTKKESTAAAKFGTPEYAHLQSVRRDYPDYAVITRQIKKNSNKKVYKGLTYDYMRDYIILHTTPTSAKSLDFPKHTPHPCSIKQLFS